MNMTGCIKSYSCLIKVYLVLYEKKASSLRDNLNTLHMKSLDALSSSVALFKNVSGFRDSSQLQPKT